MKLVNNYYNYVIKEELKNLFLVKTSKIMIKEDTSLEINKNNKLLTKKI